MSVLRCSYSYRVPLFSSSGDAICQTTRKVLCCVCWGSNCLFRLPFSFFSFLKDRVSLFNSYCSGTCHIDSTGLELT